MKRMSPEAKVGLLVLTGLLLLVYMSFKVGKLGLGPGGGYQLLLELDNVAGLAREGEVLVAGIPVGLVEDIRLSDGRAVLVLRIRDDVTLPSDSRGALRTHGVLGEKYVEVVPGKAQRELKDGDVLQGGVPPGDLDRLVTNLNDVAEDLKRVTERLANVLGTPEGEQNLRDVLVGMRDAVAAVRDTVQENREAVHNTLTHLERLSADLAALSGRSGDDLAATLQNARQWSDVLVERTPAVADGLQGAAEELRAVVAENRDVVRDTLGNLRQASTRLSSTLDAADQFFAAANSDQGTLGRLVHDGSLHEEVLGAVEELRSVLGRLERGEGSLGKLLADDTLYAELSRSAENLRNISDKIDRGQGTLGKLVNDESVHSNLNETLKGVSDYVAGANRFQFELGYTGEYLADLGEMKNYLGLEIRPRQNYFYHVALVDDPRGETKTKVVETTTDDGSDSSTTTETRKETDENKLKFTAVVGKRFSFLTLRGGLMESTGGVGADVDFWADRLRLSLEAFDFGRDPGPPHLKLAARWMMFRNLFVTAGLDDFTYDRNRDYFVGGGLRFLDEDIKYLLSPAAGAAR